MPAKLRPYAAPATLVSVAVIVAFAVLGATAVGGGRARASQVSCGDSITADTTLQQDLVNCPNRGIEIGADGVTLDLNGHLVDGDGTPVADCNEPRGPCDVGVFNDGHDGVTVMHGSVREFDSGVLFGTATGRARNNRVLGVSTTRNQFAGIEIASQVRGLVRNSSGDGSLDREGNGLGLDDSHHVRILNNSFRHNAHDGIRTFESSRNVIRGNLTSRNKGGSGIELEGADHNRVTRNRSVRDGVFGIYVAPGNRNVIARNRISHVRGGEGEGRGIEVDGGDHNLIARNLVRGTRDTGISVGYDVVVGNAVRRNHVRGAGEDGVRIDDKARHTLVEGNHAFGARDDGIDVNNSTTKLTRNEARRNGDLGIEAVFGVIDGGGNIARHNGDPRQCTNIFCR
jgi:parallel beta-helix repeat protein